MRLGNVCCDMGFYLFCILSDSRVEIADLEQWLRRAAWAHRYSTMWQGLQTCHEAGKVSSIEWIFFQYVQGRTGRAWKIWKLRHLHINGSRPPQASALRYFSHAQLSAVQGMAVHDAQLAVPPYAPIASENTHHSPYRPASFHQEVYSGPRRSRLWECSAIPKLPNPL